MRGTTEEKASAAETHVSYCGRYDVKGEKTIHRVEVSFFPNWIGLKQERFYKFEGDDMQQSTHLVWKRVKFK